MRIRVRVAWKEVRKHSGRAAGSVSNNADSQYWCSLKIAEVILVKAPDFSRGRVGSCRPGPLGLGERRELGSKEHIPLLFIFLAGFSPLTKPTKDSDICVSVQVHNHLMRLGCSARGYLIDFGTPIALQQSSHASRSPLVTWVRDTNVCSQSSRKKPILLATRAN